MVVRSSIEVEYRFIVFTTIELSCMLSLLQELGILISPPTINYDNMGNVSLSQSSFSFANERYNNQLLFCLRQSGFRSASRLTCNLSRLDSESSHQLLSKIGHHQLTSKIGVYNGSPSCKGMLDQLLLVILWHSISDRRESSWRYISMTFS